MARHTSTSKRPVRKIVGTGVSSTVVALALALLSAQTGWTIDPGLAAIITAAVGTFTGYLTPPAPVPAE